jgi:AAA domain
MNPEEKLWFRKLTAKRQNTVYVLKEDGFIEVVVSHIVDTYRDSAHFIYELLQNADDVNATKVRFELRAGGLVVAHNGSINFSITDPDKERKEGVVPGHINAITTFSLSAKKEDIENKIGKFGIGFKSVFQYTDTPYIINPPYSFTIKNYMIPYVVSQRPGFLRAGETTAFYLPFDKRDKPIDEAFSEISAKLNELKNPLLFLRNLSTIEVKNGGRTKLFIRKATLIRTISLPNIEVHQVKLDSDSILRFSRKISIVDKNRVSHLLSIGIGFILEGGKVSAHEKYRHYSQYAWCFFPTKQPTSLNYIINAPFILTPNREALKEGRIENNQLITGLSNLMESAIQGLKALGYITEGFFTTIPIPVRLPYEFRPIGEKVISKLKSGEFIPTRDGKHIAVADAFVCREAPLVELLEYNNCIPLQNLTNRPKAKIVFSDGKIFTDSNLFQFVYKELSAIPTELNANWLGGKYKSSFLEGMPEDFDIMFFKYLTERANAILGKGQPLWLQSFVPVENGPGGFEVVGPNDSNGEPQVFIEGSKIKGRYIVVDYLANEPEIRRFLLTTLNFRIPNDLDDFLLNLGKYEGEKPDVKEKEILADNLKIKRLLYELSPIFKEKLIKKLRQINFLPVINSSGDKSLSNSITNVVYLQGTDIKKYFSKSKEKITWLNINLLGLNKNPDDFKQFIDELTIETVPFFQSSDNTLDGLSSFITNITLSGSIYLANVLHEKNCYNDIEELKEVQWIFDNNSSRKAANEIKYGELHPQYPHFFNAMHLELGAIVETVREKYVGLNDAEKEIMEIINNSGEELSPDEIKNALAELIREKKSKKKKRSGEISEETKDINEETGADSTTPEGIVNSWIAEPLAKNEQKNLEEALTGSTIPTIPNSADFWRDDSDVTSKEDNPGGYVSAPIVGTSYKDEKETRQKQQMEKEIERESKRNKLIELAGQFEHYSFGWFKTLLELEDNFTSEDRVKRNPVRVVFNTVALDPEGLLVLSDTVYIPPTIEEIGELSIQLVFGDDKRTIKGEVVSPKKQVLFIKLSNPDQLKGIDLEKVSHVIVEASSPDFILEKLKAAFSRLDFDDTDNLKSPDILPRNLNFVFGPPGTGKTTYLSWLIGGKNPEPLMFVDKAVVPLMEQEGKKVLVLNPTNKAADILVQRILRNYQDADDYPQWLIRFGQSEALEREPVFVGDRILKPWVYDKCTLVTTIARFPYDYFKIEKKEEFADWRIKDFNWDVIIFDEASMIHQSALLYVVYYARQINPHVQFYIGGDPFQIPPIIQFEYPYWSYLPEPATDNYGKPIIDENGEQMAWKQDGGNIYSFVGLMKDDSFSKPVTEPHKFLIHNLRKQFRSVVPIGALFSHYRYGGNLSHHRTPEAISLNANLVVKEIEIPGLPLKPLTIIKFPVKKHEGVYRVRAIKGSPYQIYSSIFCVELIKYIQHNVRLKDVESYRIGIISPYAIQSNIISKLLNTIGTGPIEVVTGTVHSFQGDECDLVIVVLNPPKNINRSVRTFVNKKNILNVAISRAKDKMIIMTPYDPDNELNIDDLHQIRWIVKLAGTKLECKNDVIGYESPEIEKKLWNNDKFIEDSTFPTTHQSVNIYTKAIRRYEIRQDENAIDVQIHTEIIK